MPGEGSEHALPLARPKMAKNGYKCHENVVTQ